MDLVTAAHHDLAVLGRPEGPPAHDPPSLLFIKDSAAIGAPERLLCIIEIMRTYENQKGPNIKWSKVEWEDFLGCATDIQLRRLIINELPVPPLGTLVTAGLLAPSTPTAEEQIRQRLRDSVWLKVNAYINKTVSAEIERRARSLGVKIRSESLVVK